MDGLGLSEDLLRFPGLSPMYVEVYMLLNFHFFSLVNLSFLMRGFSHKRQKGRGKITFLPLFFSHRTWSWKPEDPEDGTRVKKAMNREPASLPGGYLGLGPGDPAEEAKGRRDKCLGTNGVAGHRRTKVRPSQPCPNDMGFEKNSEETKIPLNNKFKS